MKAIHLPNIDARYWTAITLASIFGTNLGDLYAHESGLGIVKGLALLALLAAFAFAAERWDNRQHEAYYWLVIILIRTGATNIADYLAYKARVPEVALVCGLILLLVVFGWGTSRAFVGEDTGGGLPKTNASYWLAMLTAGVFGTVLGDICEHAFGEGRTAASLTVVLLVVLSLCHRSASKIVATYWAIVATARTAGTAIGDWLAENEILPIGLKFSTLASGLTFLAILLLWRSVAVKESAPPNRL